MDPGGSKKTAAMDPGGSEKTDATIKIEKLIDSIPEDDHTKAEGLIRRIDKTINALPSDEKGKDLLENRLQDVALIGLDEELRKIMKSKGLALEGLPLVRENLTTKPDLASFFFENKGNELNQDLKKIQRKIGPQLEVLGELIHRGLDPSDDKVKKLVDLAPFRSKLAKMRDNNELQDLDFCQEDIEAINDVVSPKENTLEAKKKAAEKKKEEQEEKLKKAKELMDHAKSLADEGLEKNKTNLNDMIKEIREKLDLPSDWNQHHKESPNDMLDQLQSKIQTLGEFEESVSPCNSVEEIAANASGGLALKGIMYSHSGRPTTAKIPILNPPSKVNSWNAQSPYETGYRHFSDESSAARFSKEVESSGFTHADSVSVSFGFFSSEASVSYGSQSSKEQYRSTKGSTTCVSATHFCRSAMKCFAIPRHYMCLCNQACAMALRVHTAPEVRRFFNIYGTHIPYSVHQLGGVFFSTSNANSTEQMQTSKLMHLNTTKLTTQVSVGAHGGSWGVGVSDEHGQDSSAGSIKSKEDEHKNVSYTFSVKSIGPHADNPASFKKALSTNNATWAVVDRGDTSINVPVWELLRECGTKFHLSAKLMEETWEKDEKKKKELKESKQGLPLKSRLFDVAYALGGKMSAH